MNIGLILAGGVGQRMRTSGMPKQFLKVYGKPICIYTLEKFERCQEIDAIVVVCNPQWCDYMRGTIEKWSISKAISVVDGGKDRNGSIINGMKFISANYGNKDDIIIIHDAVRPLIEVNTISENIRMANKYGCAMTVHPVTESVVVCNTGYACFDDFKKRSDTYSLTSPQSFKYGILEKTMEETQSIESDKPLLDVALAYTFLGNRIHYVQEENHNIKVTTSEDYYTFKAILDSEESKAVLGIR